MFLCMYIYIYKYIYIYIYIYVDRYIHRYIDIYTVTYITCLDVSRSVGVYVYIISVVTAGIASHISFQQFNSDASESGAD